MKLDKREKFILNMCEPKTSNIPGYMYEGKFYRFISQLPKGSGLTEEDEKEYSINRLASIYHYKVLELAAQRVFGPNDAKPIILALVKKKTSPIKFESYYYNNMLKKDFFDYEDATELFWDLVNSFEETI